MYEIFRYFYVLLMDTLGHIVKEKQVCHIECLAKVFIPPSFFSRFMLQPYVKLL